MNRNVESHFSELPSIDIERSMFDRSSSHKTSFQTGQLVPFYIDEVLPGDTFNVTTSCVVRLQTLLTPIMDNMYLDTYYFFVPNRLVWEHWKQFMGENRESAWTPSTEYRIPQIIPPDGGWNVGTIADYFGIPVKTGMVANVYPNALPFRAYALICDTWFRDQNLTDPLNIPFGDAIVTGSNGYNYIIDTAKGGLPFKVAKYHDYFTSCLPNAQKGNGVNIFGYPMNNSSSSLIDTSVAVPVFSWNSHDRALDSIKLKAFSTDDKYGTMSTTGSVSSGGFNLTSQYQYPSGVSSDPMIIRNLWAEMDQLQVSINQLRLAFQMQKWQEKNALGGTRYHEILKEHFSVTPQDARVQIPEYLGGHRIPLSIHQVANQSQGENEFLGDLGAMSNTSDVHEDFVKSFVEHGFVIGVCCVRYDHSYPQGEERFWMRRSPMDYYWPVFANIGNQPVYRGEIMVDGQHDAETFGFQEAWADYRYKPNRVSGQMRPGIPDSLASWHLADYYTTAPSLSDAWIREDMANVDRCLAVTSSAAHQIFADFYVKNICTRAMPMYSIPGLIDHH